MTHFPIEPSGHDPAHFLPTECGSRNLEDDKRVEVETDIVDIDRKRYDARRCTMMVGKGTKSECD